jgi:transposase-like protein
MLSRPYFHDEAAAYAHLEAVLWANGSVCPHCGSMAKPYVLEGVHSRPRKGGKPGKLRYGLKKCGDCGKQFTVTVGTVFESAHIPLHKMLQAVYLMCASKKGVSAHQLHRTLEITYKSAWFLAHRIRAAMAESSPGPLGGLGKIIEADETYFGNVAGTKRMRKTGGASGQEKWKVVALVERGGKARSMHVDFLTAQTVWNVVLNNADRQSNLMTDESNVYSKVGKAFESHDTVNHGEKEYVRGDVTTNTVEGFFSIFKRGMKGVYQHCSEKHLHRYLAEFDFRYNNRKALGVEDERRATRAMAGITGKRLTYRAAD